MVRSMLGFATFAIVALVLLKVLGALFGFALSLVGTLLWWAFLGFVFYLILKVFAPDTARRLREMIAGKPAA